MKRYLEQCLLQLYFEESSSPKYFDFRGIDMTHEITMANRFAKLVIIVLITWRAPNLFKPPPFPRRPLLEYPESRER